MNRELEELLKIIDESDAGEGIIYACKAAAEAGYKIGFREGLLSGSELQKMIYETIINPRSK